jgi:hypothetical protein
MANVLIVMGFPYAADGISAVMLATGSRADIRDELVPGLAAEGWIDPGDSSLPARTSPPSLSGPSHATPLATSSNPDGAVLAAKPAQRRR